MRRYNALQSVKNYLSVLLLFLILFGIFFCKYSSNEYPSVQHNSSTQGPHLYGTQNPSVPHQKPLSSTHPLTWGVFGVELRGVCGTEGGVWNWGDVWKGVALLCGTDVLNWGGWNWGGPSSSRLSKFVPINRLEISIWFNLGYRQLGDFSLRLCYISYVQLGDVPIGECAC